MAGEHCPQTTGQHPWEEVVVDILTLPTTNKGNEKIALFVCTLTRAAGAIPLADDSAASIAKAFVGDVMCRHGAPAKLLSDRGGNFLSELVAAICHHLSTHKVNSTSYRPQTQGLVERLNGTLGSMLRCCADIEHEWQSGMTCCPWLCSPIIVPDKRLPRKPLSS